MADGARGAAPVILGQDGESAELLALDGNGALCPCRLRPYLAVFRAVLLGQSGEYAVAQSRQGFFGSGSAACPHIALIEHQVDDLPAALGNVDAHLP